MDLPRPSRLTPYAHSSLFGSSKKKIDKITSPHRSAKAFGHSISTIAARVGQEICRIRLVCLKPAFVFFTTYGLHNALFMQRAQRRPFATPHLFHHCSPLVLLPELGGRSAHDLPILIGSAQVCTSRYSLPKGPFGQKGLVFASLEAKPSFESGHEFFVESGGEVGFGKNRKTRSFFTNRL